MDYKSFSESKKSFVVAPAGYGKTHAIVESLKTSSGRQLILTHTHAGVSSIKEKISKSKVASDRYSVETISSFVQRYLKSLYAGSDIPEQDSKDKNDPLKDYHSFIISKFTSLLSSSIVRRVITTTYSGLYVDEYQDCTEYQHIFLMKMAEILPIRILGDPLQGIFDFNGKLVNFETDFVDFQRFPDLEIPYRWYKDGNNSQLGDLIKEFREPLMNGQAINVLTDADSSFYVIRVNDGDFDNSKSVYRKKMASLLVHDQKDPSYKSLLIIVPEYTSVEKNKSIRRGGVLDRAKILSKIDYKNEVTLLEAIDDSKFYSLAKKIDSVLASYSSAIKPIKKLHGFLCEIFLKTSPNGRSGVGLNDWIASKGRNSKSDFYLKSKRNDLLEPGRNLIRVVSDFQSYPSKKNILKLIVFMMNDLRIRVIQRRELVNCVIKALSNSIDEDISVYESMKSQRNIIRRVGRKVYGKSIGTTLLTKGLEFDTVVIFDAHKFECPKHLYVALTRCCKNLIVFTTKSQLGPFEACNWNSVVDPEDVVIEPSVMGNTLDLSDEPLGSLGMIIMNILATSEGVPRYLVLASIFTLLRRNRYKHSHEMSMKLCICKDYEIKSILISYGRD